MSVTIETAKVYKGGRRRWLTLNAAVKAEAEAIIKRKYPSERFDPGCGGGFHWRSLPRSDVLLRRISRIVHGAAIQQARLGKNE